jgi:hypothetical protein
MIKHVGGIGNAVRRGNLEIALKIGWLAVLSTKLCTKEGFDTTQWTTSIVARQSYLLLQN